mmetsp:Transcript_793/g.1549  ORF Transcript_793/g.1549 Transcript_793/m.1549 type:complete len:250 (+) Transcript_793:377-1126(+)
MGTFSLLCERERERVWPRSVPARIHGKRLHGTSIDRCGMPVVWLDGDVSSHSRSKAKVLGPSILGIHHWGMIHLGILDDGEFENRHLGIERDLFLEFGRSGGGFGFFFFLMLLLLFVFVSVVVIGCGCGSPGILYMGGGSNSVVFFVVVVIVFFGVCIPMTMITTRRSSGREENDIGIGDTPRFPRRRRLRHGILHGRKGRIPRSSQTGMGGTFFDEGRGRGPRTGHGVGGCRRRCGRRATIGFAKRNG